MVNSDRRTFSKKQREVIQVFENVFSKGNVFAYKEPVDLKYFNCNEDSIVVVVKYKDFDIEIVDYYDINDDEDPDYEEDLEDYKRDSQEFTGENHTIRGFVGAYVIRKDGFLDSEQFFRDTFTSNEFNTSYIHSHLPKIDTYSLSNICNAEFLKKNALSDYYINGNNFCFGNIDYITERYSEKIRGYIELKQTESLTEMWEYYLERFIDLIQVESKLGGPYISIRHIPKIIEFSKYNLNSFRNKNTQVFNLLYQNNNLSYQCLYKYFYDFMSMLVRTVKFKETVQHYIVTSNLSAEGYELISDFLLKYIKTKNIEHLRIPITKYYIQENSVYIRSLQSHEEEINKLVLPLFFNKELMRVNIFSEDNSTIEAKVGIDPMYVHGFLYYLKVYILTNHYNNVVFSKY